MPLRLCAGCVIHAFYRHRWSLIAIGSVLWVYFAAFSQIPTSVFWSPDEGSKFIQLHTVRWEDGLQYQIPYAGQRLDPAYKFYPQSPLYPHPLADGRVRFHWPIWFPLISIIPFKLLGIPGLYFIPLASGLLIMVLVGWLAYRLLPPATPLAIVIVGLASPIFFYSLLFWEHTLVVLIGLAAFWQVMRIGTVKGRTRWLTLTLTSVLLVSAVTLRLEMFFYAMALILATGLTLIIHHRQRLVLWTTYKQWDKLLIVIVITTILLIFLLSANFPGLMTGWGLLAPRHQQFIENGLLVLREPNVWFNFFRHLREIWINAPTDFGPRLPLPLAWIGLIGIILGGLVSVIPKRTQIWLLAGSGLLVGLVSGYVLFSPLRYRAIHSLFLLAPHLVFAFLFLDYARREPRFEITLLGTTTILYLIFGTTAAVLRESANILNMEWGPRYLLTIYPLAGICAAVGIYYFYQTTPSNWNKRLLVGLAALLILIGVEYEVRGVQEIQTTKKALIAYSNTLEATDQSVVTDLYWLPSALGTRFIEQEIYTLARREDLYTWLNLTKGQVDSFLFVSFTPLEPDFIKMLPQPIVPNGERVVYGLTFAEFEVLNTNDQQGETQ